MSTSAEYKFGEIIEVCREINAFTWRLSGKWSKADGELSGAALTWFGKLFSDQYGGTFFALADGRRVQFGRRGKARQRRYIIQII